MATDWVTVAPSLNPISDSVEPTMAGVESLLSILIGILNVVQNILNVLKAFSVGLIDPIQALLDQLLAEVQGIISDLSQIGFYITGDWAILREEDKFSSLLGGYSAFERRMVARILDQSDPSAPKFSDSTAVLGAFFFVSSADVNELIRLLNSLLRFFGRSDLMARANPYGTPAALEIKYGSAGTTRPFMQLAQATETSIPDAFTVRWSMSQGVGGNNNALVPAPKGFLIHVSTIPEGLQVLSLTTKSGVSGDVTDLPRVSAAGIDPITNGPLLLFGGVADIGVVADSEDFSTVEKSANQHAPLLVLQMDQNTPLIRPSLLVGEGDIPLVANTYFVKTGFTSKLAPGSKFAATFRRSELPQKVSLVSGIDGFAVIDGTPEAAENFYVRVRAVTTDFIDSLRIPEAPLSAPVSMFKNTRARMYRFSYDRLLQAQNGVLVPENPGLDGNASVQPSSITPASSPSSVVFPSSVQATYIEAVQAAVALAILCRADLTEMGETFQYNTFLSGQGLRGLEGAGRDLISRYGIQPSWFKTNRPQQFRLHMRWVMARVATDLLQKSPPPDLVSSLIVSQAQPLLEFRWSDISSDFPNLTILESIGLGGSDSEDEGIGGNPFCRFLPKENFIEMYRFGGGPHRSPSFAFKGSTEGFWIAGEGSADWSPVLFQDREGSQRVEYVRNAVSQFDDGSILISATKVLQLAAAPLARPIGDTQWISVRAMSQGWTPADELLSKLQRFLDGLSDGAEGIEDQVETYIEAIQARIYQYQSLLNEINSLLRAMDFFQLPSASGLIFVESGTAGVLNGFLSAENKPSDTPGSYGAGIALVSGGVPTALLETLSLILGRD